MGLFAADPRRQVEVVDFVVQNLPGSQEFIRENLEGIVRLRGALGLTAIFGLLWTASAVFGSIVRVINKAWAIHKDRPFYKAKPRQVGMALGLGVLFFISLGMTSAIQWAASINVGGRTLEDVVGGVGVALLLRIPGVLITLIIFLLLYKFVPNTRTYWGYVWVGAVLATVLFEAAKGLFVMYLDRFANYSQVYGSIAAVVALMVWVYVSAMVLIIGAEAACEYGRMRTGLPRGRATPPAPPPEEAQPRLAA